MFNFKKNAERDTERLLEVSKFINDFNLFLVKERVFNSIDDVSYFFCHGECYTYAKILKRKFPWLKILITYDSTHALVKYKNMIFDVDGIFVDKKETRVADKFDIHYMKHHFGYCSYYRNDFSDYFVTESLRCFEEHKHFLLKINMKRVFEKRECYVL